LTNREANTRLNIYTNVSTTPKKLVKIGLVVSEISLLQAIVKKRKKKNESNTSITLQCGPMPNVTVALLNIGGALCSMPQSLTDAHYLTAVQ